jgi:RNA polymerase sigma-70 factor (ECF subfamily)
MKKKDAFAQAALAELDRLYSAAHRLCWSPQEAEDLVQEVYAHAFEKRNQLLDLAKMRGWLHRTLNRKFIDHLRKKQRTPTLVSVDGLEDYEVPISESDLRIVESNRIEEALQEEVEMALRKLPEDQRAIVVLREISGLTYEEISEATSCPVGTVRSRLSRARRNMQKSLYECAVERGIVNRKEEIDRGTS